MTIAFPPVMVGSLCLDASSPEQDGGGQSCSRRVLCTVPDLTSKEMISSPSQCSVIASKFASSLPGRSSWERTRILADPFAYMASRWPYRRYMALGRGVRG